MKLIEAVEQKQTLAGMMSEAIRQEVERIAAEEVEAAVQQACVNTRRRVRECVGGLSAKVPERFTYERVGSELVIRVDFQNLSKGEADA